MMVWDLGTLPMTSQAAFLELWLGNRKEKSTRSNGSVHVWESMIDMKLLLMFLKHNIERLDTDNNQHLNFTVPWL